MLLEEILKEKRYKELRTYCYENDIRMSAKISTSLWGSMDIAFGELKTAKYNSNGSIQIEDIIFTRPTMVILYFMAEGWYKPIRLVFKDMKELEDTMSAIYSDD